MDLAYKNTSSKKDSFYSYASNKPIDGPSPMPSLNNSVLKVVVNEEEIIADEQTNSPRKEQSFEV